MTRLAKKALQMYQPNSLNRCNAQMASALTTTTNTGSNIYFSTNNTGLTTTANLGQLMTSASTHVQDL